ncbi:helix-turn-helix domain-containing protein [Phyllobacterium myrsinacearum]|uniref:HTH araC/xylS-type domain-containing protein n=1 Tax=Phyllobacterium myrsinacearum TaxID=28101 RepID=A0A2S9JPA3_9HYPH|nr:AraC family transcriptional regulator [Phyllobacterium myrsinacearum]PRD54989.1 hypothetical protein C5750_07270 [Phyllobacterium myrsinacearum]PWV90466.1 AraC-like DNA-binding protein [Phyllobacterium myrsinacearum]RZS79863.1 AraC-like DNA-binding protein [Phyllobacterium myrsinacearum]RZV05341.1 AraC-like DNA-binding protein [Phyllobacterium myrsinacearum]
MITSRSNMKPTYQDVTGISKSAQKCASATSSSNVLQNSLPYEFDFTSYKVSDCISVLSLDIHANCDSLYSSQVDQSLVCLVLLAGSPVTLHAPGRPAVLLEHKHPVIINFADGDSLELWLKAGTRCTLGGISLCPDVMKSQPWLTFADELAPLTNFCAQPHHLMKLPPSSRLVNLANETLSREYDGFLKQIYLESYVLSFVVEIIHLMQRTASQSAGPNSKHLGKAIAAREILDSDIANPPTARELSQRVGVNITTLRIHFRMAFHKSISAYVHDQRLARARDMLRTSTMPIADVSYSVGYTNAAAFATAYRKHFGYPPSQEVIAFQGDVSTGER